MKPPRSVDVIITNYQV